MVFLRIADIEVCLDLSSDLRAEITPQLGGFLASDSEGGAPPILFEVERLPGRADHSSALVLPRMVESFDEITIAQAGLFELRLGRGRDGEPRRGVIRFREISHDAIPYQRPVGLRGALSALWSILLPERGGMLLHASGVVLDGRGVVFAGRSGSGKSTLASMFPPESILNDELVALRQERSGWVVHSTPFSGMLHDPRLRLHAPLARGFALVKSDTTHSAPLGTKDAMRLVAACTTIVEGSAAAEHRAFGLVAGLAAGIPWRRLSFARDGEAVRAELLRWLEG